jgi:sulfate adenylyltransferase
MPDLIPVHGGLDQPVNCSVPAAEIEAFKADAAKLPKVPVPDADLSTVYRLADGALSPLTGFMTAPVFQRVLEESVIDSGGKLYAWTIPLSLPVTSEVAAQLKPGQRVALTNTKGDIVGTLDVEDVFGWGKSYYLRSVYLTERTDHPGGDMVLKTDADKTHLVGGRVRALPQPKHPKFGKYVKSPAEVRALLREKG